MKKFTSVHDVTDVDALVKLALELKKSPHSAAALGKHKTLGLIFLNPSLRTRMSTEKAAHNLSMDLMKDSADFGDAQLHSLNWPWYSQNAAGNNMI